MWGLRGGESGRSRLQRGRSEAHPSGWGPLRGLRSRARRCLQGPHHTAPGGAGTHEWGSSSKGLGVGAPGKALCGDHSQASPPGRPGRAGGARLCPRRPEPRALGASGGPRPPPGSDSRRAVPAGFGARWKQRLDGEGGKPCSVQLMGFVAEERRRHAVHPPPDPVFPWIQIGDLSAARGVILGRDPYRGPRQAHGLRFRVQRPVPPPPCSETSYKELSADRGRCSSWSRSATRVGQARCPTQRSPPGRAPRARSLREKGWEQFADAVVSWLNQSWNGLVLLWVLTLRRRAAPATRSAIACWRPRIPPHCVRRVRGCRHVSKTNELLQKFGKEPINWKDL